MRPKPLIPTRTVIPAISFVCEPRLGPHDTLTTSDKARYDRLPSGLLSSCSRPVGAPRAAVFLTRSQEEKHLSLAHSSRQQQALPYRRSQQSILRLPASHPVAAYS